MCKIYFIANKTGIKKTHLQGMVNKAINSAITNPDGFGFFNEKGKVFKQSTQLTDTHMNEILTKYVGSRFVIAHVRNATSGIVGKNDTHPFRYKNYLLVHNGILYNNHDTGTDSEKLLKDIVNNKNKTIIGKIKNVVNKTRGFLSVFLYNTKTKKLYYIKRSAYFSFAYYPEAKILSGSTYDRNMKGMFSHIVKGFFHVPTKGYLQDPEDAIYQINENLDIIRIGEVKDVPTYNKVSYPSGYYGYWDNQGRYWDSPRKPTQKPKIDQKAVKTVPMSKKKRKKLARKARKEYLKTLNELDVWQKGRGREYKENISPEGLYWDC